MIPLVFGVKGPALLQQAIKSGSFDEVRRILESNEAGIDGTIVTKVSQRWSCKCKLSSLWGVLQCRSSTI